MYIGLTINSSEEKYNGMTMAKDVVVGDKIHLDIRLSIFDTDITIHTLAEIKSISEWSYENGLKTGDLSFQFNSDELPDDIIDEHLTVFATNYVRVFKAA